MLRIQLMLRETPLGELVCEDYRLIVSGAAPDQRFLVAAIIEREGGI